MAYDPNPPSRMRWGTLLGVVLFGGLLVITAISTTGTQANKTFRTVGNSLSGSGYSSFTSTYPETRSDPAGDSGVKSFFRSVGSLFRGDPASSKTPPAVARTPLPLPESPPPAPLPPPSPPEPPTDTANFQRVYENDFQATRDHPLSTFSVDVDTASYALTRRFLQEGRLPPPDAVRVADFINYFAYDYPAPAGEDPLSITADVAGCPWKTGHRLVRIGLRGKRIAEAAMPPRNFVFLVDTSGSMNAPNRLPLVKSGLKMLIDRLTARDRVAIVVYAGSAGLCLESTPGDRKETIRQALDRLHAGGSTNGGEGIVLAYRTAAENFLAGGVNRVILATDGDFNVGVTSEGDLVRLIEEKRRSGVYLTVLGFGMSNLKDSTLEKLADKGAGHYAYIDSEKEARKVFVEEGAALVTIAKDVKAQVEFNPAKVAAYRLIGYENRMLQAQDFNDDRKLATPMGAGHTVTALYEVVPAGAKDPRPSVDPLKYQKPAERPAPASEEMLTLKVRYKEPREEKSKLMLRAVKDLGLPFDKAPEDFRFAVAAAGFGQVLRRSPHRGSATLASVQAIARSSLGLDGRGHRADLVRLIERAQTIRRTGKDSD